MKQKHKVIYKVASGSQLYGTQTPESDTDFVSVFMPNSYDLFSLQKCEQIDHSTKSSSEDRRNTKEDTDDISYSLQRYVQLALQGNPSMIEILYCQNPVIEDPIFRLLRQNRKRLLSKRVYDSFTGFGFSQVKKLEYKKKRYDQLALSKSHLEDNYTKEIVDPKSMMNQDLADWLNQNLTEYKGRNQEGGTPGAGKGQSFHAGLPIQVIYEKISEEYKDYGWRVKTPTFLTLGYDVKFAAHAIRLYHEGAELMEAGQLTFPIGGQAYNDIMRVRRGEVSLEEFRELVLAYENVNRALKPLSVLPDAPDHKWANGYLVNVCTEWIKNGGGAFVIEDGAEYV